MSNLHAKPSQATQQSITEQHSAASKDLTATVVPGIEIIEFKAWNSADGVLFNPEDSDINLTNLRLREIPDLSGCLSLNSLTLRQNLISTVKPFSATVASTLEHLDFYENQLHQLENLENLTRLVYLDVSFNQIRDLGGLGQSCSLQELYVVCNKISEICGLESLVNLRLLELGSNRIRNISGLSGLRSLEELWLGRNKIERIEGFCCLVNLRKLSLQSNRLTDIGSGLSCCASLQELYLSHNGIIKICGLESLTNLTILDLSNNQISCVEGLDNLDKLIDLWLNHNKISQWSDVHKLSVDHRQLQTLYLEGNPIAQDSEYKKKVIESIPTLSQLDWEVFG